MATPYQIGRARDLRRDQTEAERRLWKLVRNRQLGGFKFRRQYPIDHYIVDFACADARLVIELDGGQHAQRADADADRTRALESCGWEVMRFWNGDVIENERGVAETIIAALKLPKA
jgi:very-short-patch-repair endonuclease